MGPFLLRFLQGVVRGEVSPLALFPLVLLRKPFWADKVTLKLHFLFVGLCLLSGGSRLEKNLLVSRASPPPRAWLAVCGCLLRMLTRWRGTVADGRLARGG